MTGDSTWTLIFNFIAKITDFVIKKKAVLCFFFRWTGCPGRAGQRDKFFTQPTQILLFVLLPSPTKLQKFKNVFSGALDL